jgi:hypothetical protein
MEVNLQTDTNYFGVDINLVHNLIIDLLNWKLFASSLLDFSRL